MTESCLEGNGIVYRTNEFKSGRATLVFIHGLSGSASAWYPYEHLFEKTYNLLTFDLRGHGKSKKFRHYENYELKKAANDLFLLLERLHVEKCILVSHSYGTLVALEFLLLHQEKVSATVFLSPTAFLKRTRWYPLVKIVGRLLTIFLTLFPFHPTIRERVDYSPFKNTGDWNMQRIRKDIHITTLRIYLYCLVQAYAKDYDLLWKKVRVPSLIIHGKDDSIIPVQHAELLAREITGSMLIRLERANHVIVLNNVPEISESIMTFVS